MKKILTVILISLITLTSNAKEVTHGSITYSVKDSIKSEIDGYNFLTFTWGNHKNSLMIDPFRVPISKDAIPATLETMSSTFKSELEKQQGIKIKIKSSKTVNVKYGVFEGSELILEILEKTSNTTLYQTIGLLSDGKNVYNFQLNATDKEELKTATEILKSSRIKK